MNFDLISFASVNMIAAIVAIAAIESVPFRHKNILLGASMTAMVLTLINTDLIGTFPMVVLLVASASISAYLFSKLSDGSVRRMVTVNNFATNADGFDIDPTTVNVVEFPMDRVRAARPYDYQEEA